MNDFLHSTPLVHLNMRTEWFGTLVILYFERTKWFNSCARKWFQAPMIQAQKHDLFRKHEIISFTESFRVHAINCFFVRSFFSFRMAPYWNLNTGYLLFKRKRRKVHGMYIYIFYAHFLFFICLFRGSVLNSPSSSQHFPIQGAVLQRSNIWYFFPRFILPWQSNQRSPIDCFSNGDSKMVKSTWLNNQLIWLSTPLLLSIHGDVFPIVHFEIAWATSVCCC